MTYTEALDYIHSLLRFGSRPGLERITELLKRLGDPQEKLNIIHVAGTNGKGSTCVFISSILRAGGKKTGLYISPFVTSFNERIQIDGKPIQDDLLATYTERVKQEVSQMPVGDCPITEFEFITAVAFLYFYEQGCDSIVLEVGLGGRMDATNVIKAPKVSVIAQIALDHTSVLGGTEEKIAFEKCGIIKPCCPVVTTADNSDEAMAVIRKTAADRGCELTVSDASEVKTLTCDVFGSKFIFNGTEYKILLAGRHQISNAVSAICAVKAAYPEISIDCIKQGLTSATFPARCEVISRNPLVILDGSHNPNGTAALDAVLEATDISGATAIVGFMADKDVSQAVGCLRGRFKRMIAVAVRSNRRTMEASELAEVCKNICDDVTAVDSYEEALKLAGADNTLVVFGSLYLAGDIRPLLLRQFSTKEL